MCQNCVQLVERLNNGRLLVCGTDATRRTCYILSEDGKLLNNFKAHELISVKPTDWPVWKRIDDDLIVSVSQDDDSKHELHLMRTSLGADEPTVQSEKVFKFDAGHTFFTINFNQNHFLVFGKQQSGDKTSGLMYRVCSKAFKDRTSTSFTQIGTGIIFILLDSLALSVTHSSDH